jgi:polyhydroxyalkanoate synthesis regulator phasin
MIDGVKKAVRPKAVRKIDNLVGELYVHPDQLGAAVAELTRMMKDNVDAQAETVAVLSRQLAALTATVEALQQEVQALRAQQ